MDIKHYALNPRVLLSVYDPSLLRLLTRLQVMSFPKMKESGGNDLPTEAVIPTLLPLPRLQKLIPHSVTRQEIANFWRQKHIKQEEHLLAAIKAAARIRARNLTEEDYRKFEDFLRDEEETPKTNNLTNQSRKDQKDENCEIRLGIKDWWKKSKYAYLNEPAIGSGTPRKRTTSYTPYCISYKAEPLYATSLNVA